MHLTLMSSLAARNGNATPTSAAVWLPDMDLNHDKQIQSLLCYRYTIRHTAACKLQAPS